MMMNIGREEFIQEWEQRRSEKDSRAKLLRSEMQALKEYKSEFKKLWKLNTPVALSMIYENLDKVVRKTTIAHFLDKWVRENTCKRLEIAGDTWYYFDTDILGE